MRLGVISDTHIPSRARSLPPELLAALRDVDLILHCGDLVSPGVLDELRAFAPVEAVGGNGDPPELAAALGEHKVLRLDGWRIGLTHGHAGRGNTALERARSCFTDVDCIVFGHSHRAYQAVHRRVLTFNPGSPTDRRWSPFFSYGLLHLSADGLRGELVYLKGGD